MLNPPAVDPNREGAAVDPKPEAVDPNLLLLKADPDPNWLPNPVPELPLLALALKPEFPEDWLPKPWPKLLWLDWLPWAVWLKMPCPLLLDPWKVPDPTPREPWRLLPASDAVSILQQISVLVLQYCFCGKRKDIG